MSKNLSDYIINYTLLDIYSIDDMKKQKIIPIYKYDIYILIASVDDIEVKVLSNIFSYPIKVVKITQNELDNFYNDIEKKIELYKLSNDSIKQIQNNKLSQSKISLFCDKLFTYSIDTKASDIHIEATKNSLVIRFRINGVLKLVIRLQYEIYNILSSIIKLYSALDISLKRLPQNGRFTHIVHSREYDFRVSIIPNINGESIVMRILDNSKAKIDLRDTGFDTTLYNIINNNINSSSGMILVTGPTGSGKTTTLYSMLNSIDKIRKKIITVEDPIEYKIDDITQIGINNDIGLDYKTVLKNTLRQDPDVLLIGEIRDKEALDTAIQAALTGHLVIATIHTNDAIKTLTRLFDLEAKPYLVASVVKLIISQRLYRVLCNDCKEKAIHDGNEIYKSKGCPKCSYSGYSSRDIIAQYLCLNEDNIKYIEDENKLKEYTNIQSINDKLYQKVLDGKTSLNEYYRNEI